MQSKFYSNGNIMKYLILFVVSTNLLANVSTLKIDPTWKIKYDQSVWKYLFLKPTAPISSNVFEHKREKFKLILQKESHLNFSDSKDLISEKCSEANAFYSTKNGKALIENIKGKNFCYIEYKNSQKNIVRQYVYPDGTKKSSYELLSYAWVSDKEDTKKEVIKFIEGGI